MADFGGAPNIFPFLNMLQIMSPSAKPQNSYLQSQDVILPILYSLSQDTATFDSGKAFMAASSFNPTKVIGWYSSEQVGTYGVNITRVNNPAGNPSTAGIRSGGVTGGSDPDYVEINIQGTQNKPAMLNLDMKSGADQVAVLNTTQNAKITGKMGQSSGESDKDIFLAGGKNVEYQITFGKDSNDEMSIEKGSDGLTGSFTMGGVESNGINNTVTINGGNNNNLKFYQAQTLKISNKADNINRYRLEKNPDKNEYRLILLKPSAVKPDKNGTSPINPDDIDSVYTFDHTLQKVEFNGTTFDVPDNLLHLKNSLQNYNPIKKTLIQQEGGEYFLSASNNYVVFDGNKSNNMIYSGIKMYGTADNDTYEYNGKGLNDIIFFEDKDQSGVSHSGGHDAVKLTDYNIGDLRKVYSNSYAGYIQLLDVKTGTLLLIKDNNISDPDGNLIDELEFRNSKKISLNEIRSIDPGRSLDVNDLTNYKFDDTIAGDLFITIEAPITKGIFSASIVKGFGNSDSSFKLMNFDPNEITKQLDFVLYKDANGNVTGFHYRDKTIPNSVMSYGTRFSNIQFLKDNPDDKNNPLFEDPIDLTTFASKYGYSIVVQ